MADAAVSSANSDAADPVLLANIVRTDAGAHRPLPADTELAQAIRVLARAPQDAVCARQQVGNQIRDLPKDFSAAVHRRLPIYATAGLPELMPAPSWRPRRPRLTPRD